MSRKTHPKILRIRGINDWQSQGFYGRKPAKILREDFLIRKFLNQKLAEAGLESIKIERSAGKINVVIISARPGLIIGRGGEGAEKLKKDLKQKLGSTAELRMEIQEAQNVLASAPLLAQQMAKQIEKRLPFRRVMKQALEKTMESKIVKGVRVELAGRLDGNDIARREWLKKGRLQRASLRSDIDFAQATAFCTYGTIGIKVWIYKGEKFD